ncbi:MAG: S-layer homology domain-containing protein [Clostridiales bacterium]|nr:S-layer homology domain-containing protein [Clostridiales bacterium]
MKKKACTSVLSMVLSFAICLQAFAASNAQVLSEHWAFEKLNQWNSRGWLHELGEEALNPDKQITRAEFAALCDVFFGYRDGSSASNYKDVPDGSPLLSVIKRATAAGIIAGYEGLFRPDDPITREEVAIMISAAGSFKDAAPSASAESYSDKGDISSWSAAAVGYLRDKKVMVGYPDNTFRPQSNLSVAEAVSLLSGLAKSLVLVSGTYSIDSSGDVVVKAKNVVLKDMVVHGDLYIAQAEPGSSISLENATVTGRIIATGAEVIKLSSAPGENQLFIGGAAGEIEVHAPNLIAVNAANPENVKIIAPAPIPTPADPGYYYNPVGYPASPTKAPVASPTEIPSASPTEEPSASPSEEPSASPSEEPAASPTEIPSASPTEIPSASPTEIPAASPTEIPAASPTAQPEREILEITERMLETKDSFGNKVLPGSKLGLINDFAQVLENPPYSGNPYKPPINSESASNASAWRTSGVWVEANAEALIDLLRDCAIYEIWIYDGEKYAPSTYTLDGSAPYEVMGGAVEIYSGGGEKLFSYDITNEGKWVKLDLTELYPDGLTTDTLRVVKVPTAGDAGKYSWAGRNPDGTPRDIHSMEYTCDVNIAEIILIGKAMGEIPPEEEEYVWPGFTPSEEEVADFGITFREFAGTNSFFNEAMAAYDAIGFIREYHNWGWTEWAANDQKAPWSDENGSKNNTGVTSDPQVAFTNTWNSFDNYYKSLKEAGIGVAICVQGGIAGAPQSRPSFQGDTNPIKASSYLAHGQSMFQLAARYGGNADIDPSLIKVAPGTEPKIGLDYIEYYENWNEANLGPWTGAQFAAMTSADYDGHMGTMGEDVGIKNADPNAKLVLGGLAGIPIKDHPSQNGLTSSVRKFFEEMIAWFDQNRSEEKWLESHENLDGYVRYPIDVINGHLYSYEGHLTSISAEADDIYGQMAEFVSLRDQYFPNMEIWLSEFGWDSSQGSPQSATVEYERNGIVYNEGMNVGLDGLEVQGRWLVREYMILAAAGVDRVQQFMMPNAGSGAEGVTDRFATCGLIEGLQGSTNFKPSWYYVGTMNFYLDSTVFDGIVQEGGPSGKMDGPWVYRFKETANDTDYVYGLWLPTSLGDQSGGNYEDYELELPESANYAALVTLEDGKRWGAQSELEVVDGKVTVRVTEKPVFVLATNERFYKPVSGLITPLSAAKLNGDPGADPWNLFNEFSDPKNNASAIPDGSENTAIWNPYSKGKYVIVDLGASYYLTDVYLADYYGDHSDFAVYAGDLGDWDALSKTDWTAEEVEARLSDASKWTRLFDYDYGAWTNWVGKKVDPPEKARYLIVGFPSELNKAFTDYRGPVGVYEMALYGWLAEGEATPETPTPTPTAEPTPKAPNPTVAPPEDDDLVGEDFESFSAGPISEGELKDNSRGITGLYHANAEIVEDAERGNALKLTGTEDGIQLSIDATSLEAGKDYIVECEFKTDSEAARLSLGTSDGAWVRLFNSEAAFSLNSRWFGNYIYDRNVWNSVSVRFNAHVGGGYDYDLYLNGVNRVSYNIQATDQNWPNLEPFGNRLIIYSGGAGENIVFFNNIRLYEQDASEPEEPEEPEEPGEPESLKIPTGGFSISPINHGWNPTDALFDDQDADGLDPKNGVFSKEGKPLYDYSNSSLGFSDRWAYLDLGAEYEVTDIYILVKNVNPGTEFHIYYGAGLDAAPNSYSTEAIETEIASNWTEAYSSALTVGNAWAPPKVLNPPIKTRYMIFSTGGDGADASSISELIFYGSLAQ